MAERTDPSQKINHPFYCQYRAVYEYATQFVQAKHVLDIGCGEGYGAHLLAQHAKEVHAIDKHKKTIQKAQQKYSLPNLSFIVQDVKRLSEYTFDTFDIVCCFHVIEHIKEPVRLLMDIKELLSESGILLISTPNRYSPFRRSTGMEWPFHEREFSVNEFSELLTANFKNVELYALHTCENVRKFQDIRAQYVHQIFKWDIMRMRQWLPKRLLQFSFNVGGKVLKSFINATHSTLIDSVAVSDYHVSDTELHHGLDLIGVCQTF